MNTTDHDVLLARLDEIHTKLDYIVERQRFVEEFIDEMTPVGREALGVAADYFAELERKGYFAVARELWAITDNVVQIYGPGDVHELGEHMVTILDTIRNVTQPDLLAMANEATDVLHNAGEVEPIGPLGMVKATNDADVQRGMAIAVEVLKQLGKARGDGREVWGRRAPRPSDTATTAASTGDAASSEPVTPTDEPVMWEGKAFDSKGFLLDPEDWDEELATKMSAALGITLTDDHWTVVRWARSEYLESGASPNVRKVATGSGLGTRRIYQLFPKSPGKTTAMIAGIPKPVGCV